MILNRYILNDFSGEIEKMGEEFQLMYLASEKSLMVLLISLKLNVTHQVLENHLLI